MSEDGLTKHERYRLKDVEAYRKKKREWARTPDQRNKRREYMRKWREENRERHNELARQSYKRNGWKYRDKMRDRHLRNKYGITLLEKTAMIASQNGKCKICRKTFLGNRDMHIDHCHKGGNIRGVLCHVCNTKLGWFEQHKSVIQEYLKK